MRKSSKLLLVVSAQLVVCMLLWAHSSLSRFYSQERLAEKRALVGRLMLTDIALFTEARYTRHLTQADLNTPFQDFPMALEHFPSGSFVQPGPDHFRRLP